MKNLVLLSNSTLHGSGYFEWAVKYVEPFLKRFNVTEVLFIPYALSFHDEYTNSVKAAFGKFGVNIVGIHTKKDNFLEAISKCQGIYIGGGNTFRLLHSLYSLNLIEPIKKRVLEGIPYIGASAGTNVATVNICTTNDMPIIYPPSFNALGLLPFNINPHYIDRDPNSKHMGESRELRIREYHEIEGTPPVVGLKEGSLLLVEDDKVTVAGGDPAIVFIRNQAHKEYPVGSDLSFLLKWKE